MKRAVIVLLIMLLSVGTVVAQPNKIAKTPLHTVAVTVPPTTTTASQQQEDVIEIPGTYVVGGILFLIVVGGVIKWLRSPPL